MCVDGWAIEWNQPSRSDYKREDMKGYEGYEVDERVSEQDGYLDGWLALSI